MTESEEKQKSSPPTRNHFVIAIDFLLLAFGIALGFLVGHLLAAFGIL